MQPSTPPRRSPFSEFWERLAVGSLLPSWLVAVTALGFLVTSTVLAATAKCAEALEEDASAARLRDETSTTSD